MHLAIPVLKRDEPLVREVSLVESVVHWAAMTERPQGLMTLVDHAPCGAGPCSHPDETTNDEAPTLPLPEQQGAQTPPNVCIEKLEGAHHDVSAASPKELQPPAEVRIERGDAALEGLAPRSRRQLADSRVDAVFDRFDRKTSTVLSPGLCRRLKPTKCRSSGRATALLV